MLLLLCPAIRWHTPQASPPCRWDRIVMVTTTRALPLSSQSRSQHSPNTRDTPYCLLLVFVEGEDSRHLRHVVDTRDRREIGGRQPSSREAPTACFPSPHLQSFICVCAEMLSWSELVPVCTWWSDRLG